MEVPTSPRPNQPDTEAGRRARRISPGYVDSRLLQGPEAEYKPRRSKESEGPTVSSGDNYTGRRRANNNPYWNADSSGNDTTNESRHSK